MIDSEPPLTYQRLYAATWRRYHGPRLFAVGCVIVGTLIFWTTPQKFVGGLLLGFGYGLILWSLTLRYSMAIRVWLLKQLERVDDATLATISSAAWNRCNERLCVEQPVRQVDSLVLGVADALQLYRQASRANWSSQVYGAEHDTHPHCGHHGDARGLHRGRRSDVPASGQRAGVHRL